jgi:hypothetical protein
MFKKTLQSMLMLLLVVSMAACSGTKVSGTGAASRSPQTTASTSESPVQSKLAAGTLKLEGTDQAVTAEQAKELLPLWKAVKTLGSSDTISQEEIQALYDQIQETLTASQIQAITQMSLTQEDISTMMADLGIDMNSASSSGLTEEERAAQISAAQSSSSSSGSFPGGGGGFPGGGGGGFPGGGSMSSGSMPSGAMPAGGEITGGAPGMMPGAQGTPAAGQAAGAGQSFDTTNLFLDALISMLKERAAS